MSHRRNLLFKKNSGGFDFANALLFDGVNDYLDFNNYHTGSQATHAFSIWINNSNVETATVGLCAADNTNAELKVQNALNRIQYRIFTITKSWTLPFSLSNNTDYHIVMTMNALSTRIYVNGVESPTGALIHTVGGSATQNIVNVGRNYASVDYVNGKIDEWGLWYGSYLSPADVATLFGGGGGSDVSLINPATLWVGSHHDESVGNTTANLGSGGIITLKNFPIDDSQWVSH